MNPINPHGVARINLSQFLHGVTEQKFKADVYPCAIPPNRTANLLPGEWLDSGTLCTVRVRLYHPIFSTPPRFKQIAIVLK